MPSDSHPFQLEVQQVNQTCLFNLSWGRGQRLRAELAYPQLLTNLYHHWQRLYFNFYRTLEIPSPLPNVPPTHALRGRAAESGNVTSPPLDWHAELVEAEARFLSEFHRWLRSVELFEIRVAIAQASAQASIQSTQHPNAPSTESGRFSHHSPFVPVFLTCTPLDLARFPWETWQIGTEFAASRAIRIVRTPENIHTETVPTRRDRARILAILGDDTGLDFQIDRMAVQSLSRLADVQFVGWQPDQYPEAIVQQIQRAIDDEQGWDVLFFAGHSNERAITGGELSIAPGLSIAIREIAPQLQAARKRGLQFALFNSCRGLNLAESLIDLGFSQVAVMREPIHNQVAQEFLISFLQSLAQYKDVQESLFAACQTLKTEKNLTYPSAYLIPSLFCHPGATLFRLTPRGWKHRLKQLLPTRSAAIALLLTGILLSSLSPLPSTLLDWRIWTQALWRDWTHQVTPAVTPPPVALIQIDEDSIKRDERLRVPNPINRSYLADVIATLTTAKAKIIGIDYLLDRPDSQNDPVLNQTLKQSIDRLVWVVWGTTFPQDRTTEDFTVNPQIATAQWSMQGAVDFSGNELYRGLSFPNHVTLPFAQAGCDYACPFAYLLSLLAIAQPTLPLEQQPRLTQPPQDLRSQFLNYTEQHPPNQHFTWLQQAASNWVDPVIDYSIPPDRIYDRIAAWRVKEQAVDLSQIPQQVVLIASANHEAGLDRSRPPDFHPLPLAVQYWRQQLPATNRAATFPQGKTANTVPYFDRLTGGEVHAYMLQHFLTQHLILPIPDWLMVAAAILVSQGLVWHLQRLQRQNRWTLARRNRYRSRFVIATALYGILGLQLYVSAGILLPWLFPTSIAWFYLFPILRRKPNAPPTASIV